MEDVAVLGLAIQKLTAINSCISSWEWCVSCEEDMHHDFRYLD